MEFAWAVVALFRQYYPTIHIIQCSFDAWTYFDNPSDILHSGIESFLMVLEMIETVLLREGQDVVGAFTNGLETEDILHVLGHSVRLSELFGSEMWDVLNNSPGKRRRQVKQCPDAGLGTYVSEAPFQ